MTQQRADTRFKAKLRAKTHNDLSRTERKPYFWDGAKFHTRAPHINRNTERRAVPMGQR